MFQPDKDDPDNCVTSILSLGRDPDTVKWKAARAVCRAIGTRLIPPNICSVWSRKAALSEP